MDKVSAVPPLAGGRGAGEDREPVERDALRITLMSLLAKTARKRVTYGAGIEKVCRMVLTALDAAGVCGRGPGDRGVKLVWPDPQPVDPSDGGGGRRGRKLELWACPTSGCSRSWGTARGTRA
jgi:hypothetical protein